MNKTFLKSSLAFAVISVFSGWVNANQDISEQNTAQQETKLETIVLTAEEQVKQALGVSIITDKELSQLPVVNDVAEYIRRMPGVNLTGNSSTGQRGNNRQIDIRGMGPENTLILIDGKPVNSRNSVRYGWRGERDSRGDSNWVPADAIESIEVLRGPAAARYGSGAMGGVVNIKTKKVTNETHGTFEVFMNQPESSKEGSSHRESFNLSGPILKDVLSYRLYGNYNKTKADAADINPLSSSGTRAAGREGVENKDIAGRLAWQITPEQSLTFDISSGRQGNIYAGDTQNSNYDANDGTATDDKTQLLNSLLGKETNTMYRDGYAITHDGDWSWGTSKVVAQYDRTKNKRLTEALAGGPEGSINSDADKPVSDLKTYRLNGEVTIPFDYLIPQNITLGFEWVKDKFRDSASVAQNISNPSNVPGTAVTGFPNKQYVLANGVNDQLIPESDVIKFSGNREKMSSRIASLYLEDNLKVSESTDIIIGLRFDDHDKSGSNWSPSVNIIQQFGDNWKLKGGIAKAYKAPNMYQSTEGYLLYTRGNGCPDSAATSTGSCYLVGNNNLKPETSINTELGIQFEKDMVNASLTWFRNDYKNKIVSGWNSENSWQNSYSTSIDKLTTSGLKEDSNGNVIVTPTYTNLLQWSNTPKALIQGLEGSIGLDWGNISWINNFTYMIDSKDKRTGNPLSLIPNYTINSIFNYNISDDWDVNFVYTQYGRQKPREFAETRNATVNTTEVKSYGIAGINTGYKFTPSFSARVGISNLFDEKKLRDTSINQTYNEPGRAYYVNLKYEF